MNKDLIKLFKKFSGDEPQSFSLLAGEGSSRHYYRIKGESGTLIGTEGTSVEENRSFFAVSDQLLKQGLPVPRVLARSSDDLCYLQDDLGSVTLYDYLKEARRNDDYGKEESALLCRVMAMLPDIQYKGADGFDFSSCYPAPAFDKRLVEWDLNYFKYCFLKAVRIEFNESRLQDDFDRLADVLLQDDTNTFMYRDFQSRNIMMSGGNPWLIDFQGGRRGPIYYDVASFVGQSRAHYPSSLVKEMIKAYMKSLERYRKVDEGDFKKQLRYFMLFRLLQTLGAYGFRGLYEKKTRFVEAIPSALSQLNSLLKEKYPEIPYLCEVLCEVSKLTCFDRPEESCLTVELYSFSYRKGIPNDYSGNGGGFVFDCRSIENPGRYDAYKNYTGFDKEVVTFLENEGSVLRFLEHVYGLTDAMVSNYLSRHFNHLSICFGCTGGQHRSVYCTERLAHHLKRKFKVKIHVTHVELHREYWIDAR